jgi:hypothetical protein
VGCLHRIIPVSDVSADLKAAEEAVLAAKLEFVKRQSALLSAKADLTDAERKKKAKQAGGNAGKTSGF